MNIICGFLGQGNRWMAQLTSQLLVNVKANSPDGGGDGEKNPISQA